MGVPDATVAAGSAHRNEEGDGELQGRIREMEQAMRRMHVMIQEMEREKSIAIKGSSTDATSS